MNDSVSNNTMTTSLATIPSLPGPKEWVHLQRTQRAFIASGFLPDHITHVNKQPVKMEQAIAKAMLIVCKGRELGLPALEALAKISVIKGKPYVEAELQLALAFVRIPELRILYKTPVEKQHTECTVAIKRRFDDEWQEFQFTMLDAQNAGLVRPDSNWTKYPKSMLRWRAVSQALSAVCPDALIGRVTMPGSLHEPELTEDDVADVPAAISKPAEVIPEAEVVPESADAISDADDMTPEERAAMAID